MLNFTQLMLVVLDADTVLALSVWFITLYTVIRQLSKCKLNTLINDQQLGRIPWSTKF